MMKREELKFLADSCSVSATALENGAMGQPLLGQYYRAAAAHLRAVGDKARKELRRRAMAGERGEPEQVWVNGRRVR